MWRISVLFMGQPTFRVSSLSPRIMTVGSIFAAWKTVKPALMASNAHDNHHQKND
jgi:hypothetical protein